MSLPDNFLSYDVLESSDWNNPVQGRFDVLPPLPTLRIFGGATGTYPLPVLNQLEAVQESFTKLPKSALVFHGRWTGDFYGWKAGSKFFGLDIICPMWILTENYLKCAKEATKQDRPVCQAPIIEVWQATRDITLQPETELLGWTPKDEVVKDGGRFQFTSAFHMVNDKIVTEEIGTALRVRYEDVSSIFRQLGLFYVDIHMALQNAGNDAWDPREALGPFVYLGPFSDSQTQAARRRRTKAH